MQYRKLFIREAVLLVWWLSVPCVFYVQPSASDSIICLLLVYRNSISTMCDGILYNLFLQALVYFPCHLVFLPLTEKYKTAYKVLSYLTWFCVCSFIFAILEWIVIFTYQQQYFANNTLINCQFVNCLGGTHCFNEYDQAMLFYISKLCQNLYNLWKGVFI